MINTKLQVEVGIVEALVKAGSSMSQRQLFTLRRGRARKDSSLWREALGQLVAEGVVRISGKGTRNDPVIVHLVADDPLLHSTPRRSKSQRQARRRLTERLDAELAQELFELYGTNHEIETGKKPRSFYEAKAEARARRRKRSFPTESPATPPVSFETA